MEQHVHSLQTAVAQMQTQLNLAPVGPLQVSLPWGEQASPVRQSDITAMTRENSPEAAREQEQDIVNAPMASLFEVTKLRNIRSDPHPKPGLEQDSPDFIAQGKIDLSEAEQLFAAFRGTLNAYLWGGIALLHETLAETRASSALLTAAILAVTALHAKDGGRAFDRCYPVFLELAGQAVFKRYHSLDDVRGLCVGAFFLSDMSWKLSGLAVRIATELKLHRACSKALQGDAPSADLVEKARLWYLLYVCDHHFSIAYGRPPTMHEDAAITSHETLLSLPSTTQADLRLHSQVGVFVILSRALHTFGSDPSRLVANDEFESLRRHDADLSRWKDHWETRLDPDEHIAEYPAKGVLLHYHFARLQLFSIVLRGLSPSAQALVSADRKAFTNLAIGSAEAALRLILGDTNMRRAVIGVPLYLLTTISYACMFLVKVRLHWKHAGFALRGDEVVRLVEEVVVLLDETKPYVRHVAHYIGRGLNTILQKLKEEEVQSQETQVPAVAWAEGHAGGGWQGSDWSSWAFNVDAMGHLESVEPDPLYMLDMLQSQLPE